MRSELAGFERRPSLARALVVRLVIAVVVSILVGIVVLFLQFRDGITGMDDQSIAVQVQDLRGRVVMKDGKPELVLTEPWLSLFATPGSFNGYQLLDARGAVLQAGGFAPSFIPVPASSSGTTVILQRERDARTGKDVIAATLPITSGDAPYWLRSVRSLEDLESVSGQLVLRALPEFTFMLLATVVGMVAVVIFTVHRTLRPVREVSRHAAALSGEKLGDRLSADGVPREVYPLVRAINTSLDRLEADYRAQREFTAHAAHELRTPLAVLRARLETKLSPAEMRDVGQELDGLARVVEQLLCLAQLDSAVVLETTPLDAFACAVDIAREMAPLALATDHPLAADSPGAAVMTTGNATLVRMVFRNLVDNALKHTPAGTSITVSAPDERTVVVCDDGPGIPPAEREQVFERFRRGTGAAGTGAGLGMAIARRIMQLSGGELRLDAETARGARFLVIFPAA